MFGKSGSGNAFVLGQARAFCGDRGGTVAILAAVSFVGIMGVAALGVDVGSLFLDRRKAQSAADLAALAAASDLTQAERAARATVDRNRYGPDSPLLVELGVYTPDASMPAAQRFRPGAAGANAARVTLQTEGSLFFGRPLLGTDSITLTTQATAMNTALASFAIGSRLLAIDGGLLNAILGGMLGTTLSLSAMDYNALATARLDLFDFLGAAAVRARIDGPDYDSILGADVRAGDLVAAMADARRLAHGADSAVRALSEIAGRIDASSRIPINQLLDLGPYAATPLGEKPRAGVAVGALDMLTAMAQIANGRRMIEVGLGVSVPGLLGAALKVAIGERPVGTSWMTIGARGAEVHTAQTRVLLTARLAGLSPVASVNLPVYVEIASASARLDDIACNYSDPQASSVTVRARPAVIDAWIGDVSDAEFNNVSRPPRPGPAALAQVLLSRVNGRAHVTVTNLSETTLTFRQSETAPPVKKTIGTSDFLSSLIGRLTGDLRLEVQLLPGLGLPVPGLVPLVGGIVSNAVSPLDQLLSSVLTTLGVGLGQADVWVTGIRCDGAVLVH